MYEVIKASLPDIVRLKEPNDLRQLVLYLVDQGMAVFEPSSFMVGIYDIRYNHRAKFAEIIYR